MKKALLAIFVLTILMLAADTAQACSCLVERDRPEINYAAWAKAFEGAAFAGRVLSVEPSEHQMMSKITFAVAEHWRGVEGDKAVIYTPENSAMCGVSFDVGKDYVVIADSDGKKFSVYSCPSIEYARHQEKYLEALGPGKIISNSPKKFDEFGNISCEDELARLDNLVLHLQNDPRTMAFIVVYGGKTGKKNEAKARVARMKYYLTKNRGVDASRVITVDGGYRETLSGKIWTAERAENIPIGLPELTPTVSAKKVVLKGTAKIRGYNCADEMGK
ncbi:MAG TPA: hypothetical protein PKA82_14680 [Pyrinomonadaceae bacterium]|nr:hypothetical protein [Pyrinomonadaceae bacterium]